MTLAPEAPPARGIWDSVAPYWIWILKCYPYMILIADFSCRNTSGLKRFGTAILYVDKSQRLKCWHFPSVPFAKVLLSDSQSLGFGHNFAVRVSRRPTPLVRVSLLGQAKSCPKARSWNWTQSWPSQFWVGNVSNSLIVALIRIITHISILVLFTSREMAANCKLARSTVSSRNHQQ